MLSPWETVPLLIAYELPCLRMNSAISLGVRAIAYCLWTTCLWGGSADTLGISADLGRGLPGLHNTLPGNYLLEEEQCYVLGS